MKALLIDGFNFIRRLYEAAPEVSDQAELMQIVERTGRSLQRAIRQHQPSHAVCVMELHGQTWRHRLYPAYKHGRAPTPPLLLAGIDSFTSHIASLGVPCISVTGYEADDVVATLAVAIVAAGGSSVILSSDKYYLQLLRDRLQVYDHFQQIWKDETYVNEKFEIPSTRLRDYWALVGDRTNNIRGVENVGPKTARELISRCNTLDEIFLQNIQGKLGERLANQQHQAELCHQLVSLKQDVEIGVNLKELRFIEPPPKE